MTVLILQKIQKVVQITESGDSETDGWLLVWLVKAEQRNTGSHIISGGYISFQLNRKKKKKKGTTVTAHCQDIILPNILLILILILLFF